MASKDHLRHTIETTAQPALPARLKYTLRGNILKEVRITPTIRIAVDPHSVQNILSLAVKYSHNFESCSNPITLQPLVNRHIIALDHCSLLTLTI
jgi:hypothetical protein